MHFRKTDLDQMGRIDRLNLINAVSGIKPANLIGTVSNTGQSNLAIFSSVVHLGSNPALLGFVVRPDQEVRRHSYENILACGVYTINHVHRAFIEQAHYTSAKFPAEVSEFQECQLTEEYLADFKAPFVQESQLKMGMKYVQSIPIELNRTVLVIGEIQELIVADVAVGEGMQLDLEKIEDVGISGLNSYYALEKIDQFPFARPHELPDFTKSE